MKTKSKTKQNAERQQRGNCTSKLKNATLLHFIVNKHWVF